MKKYLLLIAAILVCMTGFAQKQDRAKMMEDIQKFKIDYLAKEMSLSEKDKAEFATLYKEYDDELRKTGEETFKFERQLKKKKDATDEDYKKLAEMQKKSRQDFDAVTKKYDEKFEKILSAKQIYTMHKGEEKFFEKMKEMRKKHKGDHKHKGGQDKKGGQPEMPGEE